MQGRRAPATSAPGCSLVAPISATLRASSAAASAASSSSSDWRWTGAGIPCDRPEAGEAAGRPGVVGVGRRLHRIKTPVARQRGRGRRVTPGGRRTPRHPGRCGAPTTVPSPAPAHPLCARCPDRGPSTAVPTADPAWGESVGCPYLTLRPDLDPAIAARLKRTPDGLVAADRAQHDTGEVLMLAWMDDEALHRTLTTGRATYWSRSRREYWVKGETSGPPPVRARRSRWTATATRCWSRVDQVGAACHTGDAHLLLPTSCRSTPRTRAAEERSDQRRRRPRRGDLPRAGPRPAGGAGDPAAAGRRRDAGRRLPQAGRRPGHLPAGVGRAGRRLGGAAWSRYSFIGVRSAATLVERDGAGGLAGQAAGRACRPTATRSTCCARPSRRWPAPAAATGADLPPLTGGMVGYLGYDLVRRFERLPDAGRRRPARCPSWA